MEVKAHNLAVIADNWFLFVDGQSPNGYDAVHCQAILGVAQSIHQMPQDEIVIMTAGEDMICKACPKNTRGPRKNIKFEPLCDPLSHEIWVQDQHAINQLKTGSNKTITTAGKVRGEI